MQKLGHSQPSKLEIRRDHDDRSAPVRRAARTPYQSCLQRALVRHLAGFTLRKLSNAMDLERSFGPSMPAALGAAAGALSRLSGVKQQEPQSSIDAALTFGVLWTLVGMDERWREGVRVIFRKRSTPDNQGPRSGAGCGIHRALA